jgi:hypothetical protein
MSLIFLVSIAILLVAIVLIELRAVREGDERRHHAPGYAFVIGGLVFIGIGIAMAVSEASGPSLAFSVLGLIAVVYGATRHHGPTTHLPHQPH